MLEAGGYRGGDLIANMPSRKVAVTAEKVAINAVMAGCRPEYMPVLLAALEAMADPAFTLHGAITSTGGSATLVVVNGPIRQRLGFNAAGNVFGPGWRANATIGRAIRLITLNCLGALPGLLDRSTQGHPGKYSYCIAELEEANPWEPLHVTRGLPRESSAVTVFAAEGPHNVLSHYGETAEAVVVALADAMAGLGSFSPGESFIVLAPEHVQILARDGWTKPRLREALYARARRTRADLKRGGKLAGAVEPGDETRWDPRLLLTEPELMTLKILDPMVAADEATDVSVAKRVGGLDGKVLGLLHNGKVNADRLLNLVREQLAARYQLRDVVMVSKPSASRVADPAVLDRLARECDVVVTSVGD
jgi:hypothetical protein